MVILETMDTAMLQGLDPGPSAVAGVKRGAGTRSWDFSLL
jgi:hypothetical protein